MKYGLQVRDILIWNGIGNGAEKEKRKLEAKKRKIKERWHRDVKTKPEGNLHHKMDLTQVGIREEIKVDKKICYIIGTIYIISGGFIYTIERYLSYFIWIGQMNAAEHIGSYPTSPQLPVFFTNVFVPLFIIVGIIYIIVGFVGYKRHIN